jgi:hypothetical protein
VGRSPGMRRSIPRERPTQRIALRAKRCTSVQCVSSYAPHPFSTRLSGRSVPADRKGTRAPWGGRGLGGGQAKPRAFFDNSSPLYYTVLHDSGAM